MPTYEFTEREMTVILACLFDKKNRLETLKLEYDLHNKSKELEDIQQQQDDIQKILTKLIQLQFNKLFSDTHEKANN